MEILRYHQMAYCTANGRTSQYPYVFAGKPKRLGRKARRLFERAEQGQCSIYIPTMALVELGEAYQWTNEYQPTRKDGTILKKRI